MTLPLSFSPLLLLLLPAEDLVSEPSCLSTLRECSLASPEVFGFEIVALWPPVAACVNG